MPPVTVFKQNSRLEVGCFGRWGQVNVTAEYDLCILAAAAKLIQRATVNL